MIKHVEEWNSEGMYCSICTSVSWTLEKKSDVFEEAGLFSLGTGYIHSFILGISSVNGGLGMLAVYIYIYIDLEDSWLS